MPSAIEEQDAPRLVKSPWFDHEVPFDLAAETGTRRVIREHATVGVVVTTDGSVADLPRENYCEAERRIIAELEAIGKPYVILLNCTDPDSDAAHQLAAQLQDTYQRAVVPINCVAMTAEALDGILQWRRRCSGRCGRYLRLFGGFGMGQYACCRN